MFVVIPNLNGEDYLADCINSLLAQSLSPTKIIIVDNASVDNSIEVINSFDDSRIELIENQKNFGFSGGVNVGIKSAMEQGAEFIALLNNDAVVENDWLKHLHAKMDENEKIGITTGKILKMNTNEIDSVGEAYTRWGLPFPQARGETDEGQHDNEGYVFGASGGASLYRAAMLKDVGLFDEDFFAYYEDVDISFRAQLRGWKVFYEPKAVAHHHIGATSSKMGSFTHYHSSKNFYYLYAKNMPLKLYFKYLPNFLFSTLLHLLASLKNLKLTSLAKAYLKLLLTFPRTLKKRLQIQKNREVSAKYIDTLISRELPPSHDKFKAVVNVFGVKNEDRN